MNKFSVIKYTTEIKFQNGNKKLLKSVFGTFDSKC